MFAALRSSLLFFPIILLFQVSVFAQSAKDATVPLLAIVDGPTQISLYWPNPAPSNLQILRRTKGQAGNAWIQIGSAQASVANTLVDNTVEEGQTYEYVLQRVSNNINAFGYAHTAIFPPLVEQRGKLLVFIDSTTADAIGTELKIWKDDMRGEGWQIVPRKIGPFASVQSIKNQIVADYNADPTNVKAVLLIGDVPVPYSGNTNWDGHPEHNGAWPCDAYYADVDGLWTDNTVNNTTAARTANRNIPGDGKFDQSVLPSPAELIVGRVDFSNLSEATFGATPIELLKRYIDKNHKFRTKQFGVPNKALVDDNFGYFGGEAFASDGYRNAYPLVGENNIVEGDFLNNTNPDRYLLGYACGPGSYTSAGGVGNSANFAQDTINVVFSNIFGSYHGDWDYESNPLMPSALASRGSILTCGWAGRPHWFMQALASGETIGYCTQETMNAQYNNGFFPSYGESGAHVSLLGDPTLRAHVVAPVPSISVVSNCNKVNIDWAASPDTNLLGYLVYRSTSLDGPYERITPGVIVQPGWEDLQAPADTLYYQVRVVNIQVTPGGGLYFNTSTSQIKQIVFVPGTAPSVIGLGGTITCNTPQVQLGVHVEPSNAAYVWTDPNGQQLQGTLASIPGVYFVKVTAPNGCTATAPATVEIDTLLPQASFPSQLVQTCTNPNSSINLPFLAGVEYELNGNLTGSGQSVSLTPGINNLLMIGTNNGCSRTYLINVIDDTASPFVAISSPNATLDCNNPTVTLTAGTTSPNLSYAWSGPNGFSSTQQSITTSTAGLYCTTVTATNGCTSTDCTEVNLNGETPLVLTVTPPAVLNCFNSSVVLQTTSTLPNTNYLWSGPGGFSSTLEDPTVSAAGTYSVVGTSLNSGCTFTLSIMVTASPDPTVLLQIGNPACNAPLEISSIATGSQPLSYAWSTGATGSNLILAPGTNSPVSLTVTDSYGCTASTQQVSIVVPAVLNMNVATGNYNCTSGALTVNAQATGGTSPYTYLWSNGAVSSQVEVPGGFNGTLTCTITDANGCTAVGSNMLSNNTLLSAGALSNDESAPGAQDGAIDLSISGGLAPYTVAWNNGANTEDLSGLSGGTYTASVTDSRGCTVVISVPVSTGVDANEAQFAQQISLAPNPAQYTSTLNIALHTPQPLTVKVVDTQGRLMMQRFSEMAGNHQLQLPLETLPAGTYTVQMFVGKYSASRSLLIVR